MIRTVALWLMAVAQATMASLTLAPVPSVPVAMSSSPLHSSPQTADGDAFLVVITGLGGDATMSDTFHQWAVELLSTAEEAIGISPERTIYLAEEVTIDPARIDGPSTSENVDATLRDLAGRVGPTDRIAIVIIGHGSYLNGESRINLPGPDLKATDLALLLDLFPTQRIAVVNTTSASGDFIAALSGPDRAIITATRDGRQSNATVFARFFVEAYSQDVADLDKDDRVSLLEAYEYAVAEVKRFYEAEGRMLTETAMLDDNGDGAGNHEPDPAAADGSMARRFFLASNAGLAETGGRPGISPDAAADSELRALYERKQALEERIEELRSIKDSMDPQAYLAELEALLVDLALTEREIRERGGNAPGGER